MNNYLFARLSSIFVAFRKHMANPLFLFKLAWYCILIIVFFPKYIWLALRNSKFIAFDWHWEHYGSFYYPIYRKLKDHFKDSVPILFFFRFELTSDNRFHVIKNGLPAFYRDFIDKKIVIAADIARYKKLPETIRIQLFHGFASFGSVWRISEQVDLFDVFFLPTYFTLKQLQNEYQKEIKDTRIFLVGYPKLDDIIEAVRQHKKSSSKITLFYGPTWHRKISSIFDFLPTLIEICRRNNYRLIIKLHPYLYHKHSLEDSGGIDWPMRIENYQMKYEDILLLSREIQIDDLGKLFAETDIFLTDVSGIGYEFALTTGKPIVFLGEKLKIPIDDLVAQNDEKYSNYPEIYYRGVIGPIVKIPTNLENVLEDLLISNKYQQEMEKFRKDFVPNLGNASEKAVSILIDLVDEL